MRSDLLDRVPSPRSSLRELEAELQIALRRHERTSALFKQGLVGQDQLESAADQIRLLRGRIRGIDEELADEAERLQVEMLRKKAEAGAAEAQHANAATRLARSKKLLQNNAISHEEASQIESDSRVTAVQLEAKRAELLEVELRIRQIAKRRTTLKTLLESAANAIAALKEQQPSIAQ
jgi:hypothetical protein